MRFNTGKFLIVALSVLAISCSKYNQLLKSDKVSQKFAKGLEYYEKGKYRRAQLLIASVAEDYAGKIGEDSVFYYLGTTFYKEGDFLTSGDIFEQYRQTFISTPFDEEVEYMWAKGFYFMSPPYYRDQSTTLQALSAIAEYLSHYPNSVKREDLEDNTRELTLKLYDKSFENAHLYYKIGYYNSAIIALRNALDEYPGTNHREDIYYYIVCSHYEYARKSQLHLQRIRYMNLQDAYLSFISEYPDSEFRKDADKMNNEAIKYLEKYNTTSAYGNQEE